MKIQDATPEGINKTSDSNKELNPAEKWLFDIENGKVNLFALMNMRAGQQAHGISASLLIVCQHIY
jgi:hypothetical protein